MGWLRSSLQEVADDVGTSCQSEADTRTERSDVISQMRQRPFLWKLCFQAHIRLQNLLPLTEQILLLTSGVAGGNAKQSNTHSLNGQALLSHRQIKRNEGRWRWKTDKRGDIWRGEQEPERGESACARLRIKPARNMHACT